MNIEMQNYVAVALYFAGLFVSLAVLAYKRRCSGEVIATGELCCIFWFFVALWFISKLAFGLPRLAGEAIARRKLKRFLKGLGRLE